MNGNRTSPPPATSCSLDTFRTTPVSPLASPRNSSKSYLQLSQVATYSAPPRPRINRNHRGLFALQIKYLLQVLKNAQEEKILENAKNCIAVCTRMNRDGDPRYSPLETVLELQLRSLVGNLYWELAQSCVRQHLRRSRYRRQCAQAMALRNVATNRAPNKSVAI